LYQHDVTGGAAVALARQRISSYLDMANG